MPELDYISFDRQLDNLIAMSEILITEQDDCGTQELTFDIVSLLTKVNRLCAMADVDYAIQLAQLKRPRIDKNLLYYERFQALLSLLMPMLRNVVRDIREKKSFEGHKQMLSLPVNSVFLQQLSELTEVKDAERMEWGSLVESFAAMESLIKKNLKATKFPGMTSVERVWLLLQCFVKICYLKYHFQRVSRLDYQEIDAAEAERLLTQMIQAYADSEKGKAELLRYEAVLRYDNDGKALSVEQLKEAQKALLNDVPKNQQLLYLQHVDDVNALAHGLIEAPCEEPELDSLIAVVAKWQLLSSRMSQLTLPQQQKPLYNEVFVESLNGKPVDLHALKDCIERMLPCIKRKNHWFCVWCVLRHHNLLATTESAAFARQMMHDDWFRSIESSKHFSGDTLRDYNGYLANVDYTSWQDMEYRLFKERYNKTKWSASLCTNFRNICREMEEAMCDYANRIMCFA